MDSTIGSSICTLHKRGLATAALVITTMQYCTLRSSIWYGVESDVTIVHQIIHYNIEEIQALG